MVSVSQVFLFTVLNYSLASLSRDLQSERPPRLVHTLHKKNNSVLSLAASDRYIFSGNENHEILVCRRLYFSF